MKNYFEGTQSEALAKELELMHGGYENVNLYVPDSKPTVEIAVEVPNMIKKRNARLKNSAMKEDNMFYSQALEMANASRIKRDKALAELQQENIEKHTTDEKKEGVLKSILGKLFRGAVNA